MIEAIIVSSCLAKIVHHDINPLVAPLSFKPLLLVLSLLHNLEKKKAIFYLRKKEGANGLCSRMVEE